MSNYLVVLFKDKKKKKIINKFISFDRANKFFDEHIKSSQEIVFEKEVTSNQNSEFELGLIEVGKSAESRTYLKDEFGRNTVVKIEEDNMNLVRISPIRIEETIYDCQVKKRISYNEFEKKYLKKDGVKLVSSLNNKVVVQIDDQFSIFTFKNENESVRFLNSISNYFFKIKRADCIIVKDTSKAQKKYLYSLLESKGFDKQFLYRKFTSLAPSK